MVKKIELEELRRLLDSLNNIIRRSDMAEKGTYTVINPITGEEKTLEVTTEEKTKVATDLANALKAVSDKIKAIDWAKKE